MVTLVKKRLLPKELLIYESLQKRLTQKDSRRYWRLKKGFSGEREFDQLMESLQNDALLLHDLRLEHQQSVLQIDTLLISEKGILLFEVKNFEGDYIFDSDSFYKSPTKQEILNPLHQLKRSVTLLQSLLTQWDVQLPIKGYIVFVNPHFTLYQAPANLPIILPTQLHHFISRINQTVSVLDNRHRHVADRLIKKHMETSPWTQLPEYGFEELRKGILCRECSMFLIRKTSQTIRCTGCELDESVDSGILRCIEELMILFPDQPVTTQIVQKWCGIVESPKTIRRVLTQHMIPAGSRKQRFYIPKR